MTISKRTRDRAIWILDIGASNDIQLYEIEGCSPAWELAVAAFAVALACEYTDVEADYAEAAAMLRDGWIP